MKPKMRQDLRDNLTECRAEVQQARESGEPRQISLALTALGHTLFQLKQYEEGLAVFDEAVTLAVDQEDIALQAHCLGIKSLAYQDIKRYPDAFQVAESIRVLAEKHAEIGMLCDALTSQGQILADSGEPIVALEKLREARQRSQESGDIRRQMNVLGALGNLHLMMASIEESLAYFDKSLALARDLGDRQAELGYLGNKGSILAWHEQHRGRGPGLRGNPGPGRKPGRLRSRCWPACAAWPRVTAAWIGMRWPRKRPGAASIWPKSQTMSKPPSTSTKSSRGRPSTWTGPPTRKRRSRPGWPWPAPRATR